MEPGISGKGTGRGFVCVPPARSVISIIVTNNAENLQSPARYVANEEYHHTGDKISELSREILRHLNRIGIRGVVVNKGWPMNLDRFPGKIWDVSHKIMAVEAGLGHIGIKPAGPPSEIRQRHPIGQSS